MTGLIFEGVKKSYGSVDIIRGLDLEIRSGEFIVFVGPSGCGKSTLLRMIAGLEEISGGTLKIGGKRVNEMFPSEREIAMVFQSYALYPHMTVYENMSFGMKMARKPKEEIDGRVRSAAKSLELTNYLDRLPRQLSGGQRQRVAIGRAICRDPKVFLFDEPLSNLDAALRVATRIEIAKLAQAMVGTTMIYVTHDQVEAMTLADRIVVLSAGNVEQVGAPLELYEQPANLFVARFIGSPAMNIVPGRIQKAGTETEVVLSSGHSIVTNIPTDASATGDAISFGVRPEHLRLAREEEDCIFEGFASIAEALGEITLFYFDGIVKEGPLVVKLPGTHLLNQGQRLRFTADRSKMHLFDSSGRACPRTHRVP